LKHTNLFLDSLSGEMRSALTRLCVEVDLPLRKPLYEPAEVPMYAYFLTSGIASVVAMMEDGAMAEVGLIGREGVVGCIQLLGPANVSTRCFIQLEATALRMRFADLMNFFRTNEEVRDRILEFVQEQTVSLAQLAGCNRLHSNEERLARWLLMAQDRTHMDTLHFTQEFLAMMLGARRTTVTLIAGVLQREGLIKYQRGRVRILNRENLEAASCDCYQVTKGLIAGLYQHPAPLMLATEESASGGKAKEAVAEKEGRGPAAKSGSKERVGSRKSAVGQRTAAKKAKGSKR
jgi:CRP-like cAMP-binding protein